jgi:beta-lactamase superfamily II metal-dependent hydrolase
VVLCPSAKNERFCVYLKRRLEMPARSNSKPIDPKFPKYVYAAKPLVHVYTKRTGSGKCANLFAGEWMKILDDTIQSRGRVHVRYRGGRGYIKQDDYTYRRFLEIFFIDVNQGDSILIQTPDDRRILIDGGAGDDAHAFIRGKYNLLERENYIDFEAVVATHSDSDHTGGLIKILRDPKIAVKRFYHNGLFRRKVSPRDPGPRSGGRISGLVDCPRLADRPELKFLMKRIVKGVDEAKGNLPTVINRMKQMERWKGRIDIPPGGFVWKRLDASDRYLPPYDNSNKYMTVEVLWPNARKVSGTPTYHYYGDPGKTVNGNSIVLCLEYGKHRILLAGDLNQKSMDDLMRRYARGGADPSNRLRANVYKAAHHGSQDFSIPFLKTVRPDVAIISSGDDRNDDYGHPRAVLMGTITRYSKHATPAVFCTEMAACYSPLTKKQMQALTDGRNQLYEKSIEGIVHLRSNGKNLYVGTVFGRRSPENRFKNTLWKWDIWPRD